MALEDVLYVHGERAVMALGISHELLIERVFKGQCAPERGLSGLAFSSVLFHAHYFSVFSVRCQ